MLYTVSLVVRPTHTFHFTAAVGLVHFLNVHDAQDRRVNFCVGEDSCSSQTTKEGSECIPLVVALGNSFEPQTKR